MRQRRAGEPAGIWAAQASGTGPPTLTWLPRDGDWMIVVVNGDTTPGRTVQASAGATAPAPADLSPSAQTGTGPAS
jgi:hypothetical protein